MTKILIGKGGLWIAFISVIVWMGLALPKNVLACGGQTASIGSVNSKLVAWTHDDGNPRAMDYQGNVAPEEVRIPPALADAIAEKYVSRYYPKAESVDFHAFLYEHGDYVYMYDITDPSIMNTSSVTACGFNPQKSVSNSMDIHINATTGDVWDGLGCGGGPSEVVMRFDPKEYPAEIISRKKDLTQFHSEFVIPVNGESSVPSHDDGDEHGREEIGRGMGGGVVTVDGEIDENEWSEAAFTRLDQYGKTVEIRSKIIDGTLYWAIEADTKNWLALLLKSSPHHGMVWEFTDAKLLSKNGIEDYRVAYMGMMAGAALIKDGSGYVLSQAVKETENGRIYEFSMPLRSGADGVNLQIGEYGNMAFYFGSSPTFSGKLVYEDAFSKQMMMHVGKEIHQSVMSKIIPAAIAAEFGADGSATNIEAGKVGRVRMYLYVIGVGGGLYLMLRNRKRRKNTPSRTT